MDKIVNKIPGGTRTFAFEEDMIRVSERNLAKYQEFCFNYDTIIYPLARESRSHKSMAWVLTIFAGLPAAASPLCLAMAGEAAWPSAFALSAIFLTACGTGIYLFRKEIKFIRLGQFEMSAPTHEELEKILRDNKHRYIARKTDSIYKLQGIDSALGYLAHLERSDVLSLSEYEKYATEVKNREAKVGFNVTEN